MTKEEEKPDFRKLIESISHSHGISTVFSGFIRLTACALAAQTREAEYLEEVKRWKKEEVEIFTKAIGSLVNEMEGKPFEDVIGPYYTESVISRSGAQWSGTFYTPKPVCDCMAMITAGDSFPEDRVITVCEPCCGAGQMILSLASAMPVGARRRLRVTAVDINPVACDMCYINTTLWHIPTRVVHGNTLSMELWKQWPNFALMLSPQSRPELKPCEPLPVEEVKQLKKAMNQQELQLA